MTEIKVIRDASGALINIGAWDYEAVSEPTGLFDAKGAPLTREVAKNPLPAGAYEDTADIVKGPDGGLYEKDDARAKG